MKTKKENAIYKPPFAEFFHLGKPMNILATLSATGEFEDFEVGEDLE